MNKDLGMPALGGGLQTSAATRQGWTMRVGVYRAALLTAAFAAISLGLVGRAAAESPLGCTDAATSVSVTPTPSAKVSHGASVCYAVCYGATGTPNPCDIANLNATLTLPNGAVRQVLINAPIAAGTFFCCPSADPRCNPALTAADYCYTVDHADEALSFNGCPPVKTAGSGKVVAYTEGSGDSQTPNVDEISPCATANNSIKHACCDKCAGTCTDVSSANLCPAPKIFTPDKSCSEVNCSPPVCRPADPPCEAGQQCNPATGQCVDLPDPQRSTPCETDHNQCTIEHCDGEGSCVLLRTVCDDLNACNDDDVCTLDRCDIDLPTCCENRPIPCPERPCFRLTGCDPIRGCQYDPDCRAGLDCCPDDGNPCTHESCNQDTGRCESKPDCTVPADCDDGLNCTVDTCINSCCGHQPLCSEDECFKGEACSGSEPCLREDGCQGVCHHTTAGPTKCFFSEYGCGQFQPCVTDSDCPSGTACAISCCAPSCVPLCGNSPATAAAPDPSDGTSSSGDAAGELDVARIVPLCCADGASCDDFNACTEDDCVDGCCEYSPRVCPPCSRCDPELGCVRDCRTGPDCCPDDGNPCTHEFCDPNTGLCGADSDCTTDSDCEDGRNCTVNACVNGCCERSGLCPPGVACCADGASCDDGNACTDDFCVDGCCENTPHVCPHRRCSRLTGCDPILGCQYAPDCREPGPDCCPDDGNPCTHEFCNAGGFCDSTPDCKTAADCDDGRKCTVETCTEGCCGDRPLCPAGSVCCADGASCDDGDACTDDSCGADGCCVHTPHVCPERPCFTLVGCTTGCEYAPIVCDDPVCQSCNPITGVCEDDGRCGGICRTPGFWGTHANNRKANSRNITQAVINAGGGSLKVCGECINATVPVNNAASATEALCVSPRGAIVLQNARQLTALALNCVISGFGADCSGNVALAGLFNDCNNACKGSLSIRTNTRCRDEIDCFNNGGRFDQITGTCTDGGPGNCHDRPLVNAGLGLNFDPPGPAGGSDDCNAANGNKCAVLNLSGCTAKNGAGEACCGTDSCP